MNVKGKEVHSIKQSVYSSRFDRWGWKTKCSRFAYLDRRWKLTDEPVTCKRCKHDTPS